MHKLHSSYSARQACRQGSVSTHRASFLLLRAVRELWLLVRVRVDVIADSKQTNELFVHARVVYVKA